MRIKAQFGTYDPNTRSVPIVASTTNPVNGLAIKTWDLDRFKKNPVVLWAHDQSKLPIGLASDVSFDPATGLAMVLKFASEKANPFAEQLAQCTREGLVRAVSVGFEQIGDDAAKLDEVSLVPVGADEDAGTSDIDPDAPINEDVMRARLRHAASQLARHRNRFAKSSLAGVEHKDAIEAFDKDVLAMRLDAEPAASGRPDATNLDSLGEGEVLRIDAGGKLGKFTRTSTGGAKIPSRLSRTGVLKYLNPDGTTRKELRLSDEIFKADSLTTLEHVPVIDIKDHTGLVTTDTWRKVSLGHVVNPSKEAGRFITGDLLIQDGPTLDAIERGERTEISLGYRCRLDMTPGVHEGEAYDCVQREIRYNHAALCPPNRGRAGPEVGLRLDGKADAPQWGVTNINEDEEREIDMVKIKLDGKEFEVGSQAHLDKIDEMHEKAIEKVRTDAKAEGDKLRTDLADATKRADKAEGERDTAKSTLEQERADAKARADKDKDDKDKEKGEWQRAKRMRRTLERQALRFFTRASKNEMDDEKMDAMSDRDLMLAVLGTQKNFDAKSIEGKSDDYVQARFDSLCETTKDDKGINGVARAAVAANQQLANAGAGGAGGNLDADDDPVSRAVAARDKRANEMWKQPVPGVTPTK